MNHRNRIVAAVVFLLPAVALAQVAASAQETRRTRIVASAQKGAPFQEGRQAYQVIVGLRAAVRGPGTAEARLSALGVPTADLVEEKGPFVVYARAVRVPTAEGGLAAASAVNSVDSSPTYPVVVNVRTGELGVLPGVIIVKLARPADAEPLATANGLAVDFVAENIGYAFLKVPDGRDVVAAAAAVARDPRVTTAYPEVREHFAVPR